MKLVMKTSSEIVKQREKGEEVCFRNELSDFQEFQGKYEELSNHLGYTHNPVWAWDTYAGCKASNKLFTICKNQDEFLYSDVLLLDVPQTLVTLTNFHLWEDYILDKHSDFNCIFDLEGTKLVQATFPSIKPEYVIKSEPINNKPKEYNYLNELYKELCI